jgi:tRNA dimethylallyltransferase
VAGGTGFYLKALIDGLFEGPARSEHLRERMRRIIARKGAARLHALLRSVDPRSAERISVADTARIIRALEVYFLTGRQLSSWQSQPRTALQGFRWLRMGIAWPREQLYERINGRVGQMYEDGLVEEARAILSWYSKDCHALKAIGYRQCSAYLEGRCMLEQAIADTRQETRRYAKRQLTWFRSLPDVVWINGEEDFERMFAHASRLTREWLSLQT